MSWAISYIDKLQKGETVQFRPKGNSMSGRIESGQLCTVSPDFSNLKVDDIVLCKVKGKHYLHKISAIRNNQFQISNNKGFVNGWISVNSIYGVCIDIK